MLIALVLLTSAATFAQTNKAGKIFISDKKTDIGKAYTLGSDNALKKVLDGIKAYNALDLNKYISFGAKEFYNAKSIAFQKKWFDSLSKVEEKPMLAFPLRIEGSKEDIVFMIAEENREFKNGSKVFLKAVSDAHRFGVAQIKGKKIIGIEEKPAKPKSDYAVTGLYLFDTAVFDVIKNLKPSGRGELEITDVNNEYIKWGDMRFSILEGFWSDAGTFDSLLNASLLVSEIHGGNDAS